MNALKDEDEDVTDEQIAADSPAIGPLDDPYADAHLPLPLYNWTNFFAYATYCPLYIAGPVLSFNAFVRGMHQRQTVENPIYYGLRWVACLGLLEWLLTEFPFFAVINSGLFAYLSVGEMVVVAYGVLKLMWLKFTLIWRFFRLCALLDGQVDFCFSFCLPLPFFLTRSLKTWAYMQASLFVCLFVYLFVCLEFQYGCLV